MTSFVNYLLESGISLSLFALVYFLFLRKETFFRVNRWFLLVSIVFSAVLPLLHIPFYAPQPTLLAEVKVTPYVNLLSAVTVYGSAITSGAEQIVLTYGLLGYLYVTGVFVFLGIFLLRILQIIRIISKHRIVVEGKIRFVVLDKEITPFSFLNYIFVGNNLQATAGWEKMLEHEKQHIQQGHTFDVLILEIIAVFQWFNPFFWMFRRALRENHEFLADQAVISQGTVPSWYKQILLSQYLGGQIVIANNFNYSLIKTRIKMMSKIKSRKIANVKILIGIVLAVSLVAVFACEQKTSAKTETTSKEKSVTFLYEGHTLQVSGDSVGIEKLRQLIVSSDVPEDGQPEKTTLAFVPEIGQVYTVVEQMPEFQGGVKGLQEFLVSNIKYPEDATKRGIQGKVYVSFIVAADGSVRNAKILKGVNEQLDLEAMRVINAMPKWKPGKQSGKEVAVQFTLPIFFALR